MHWLHSISVIRSIFNLHLNNNTNEIAFQKSRNSHDQTRLKIQNFDFVFVAFDHWTIWWIFRVGFSIILTLSIFNCLYVMCLTHSYNRFVYVISLSSISVFVDIIVWGIEHEKGSKYRALCILCIQCTIEGSSVPYTVVTDYGLELCFHWN